MNVMLQRHAARYIYVIPDGLRELMSDISREVLRSQPENIYIFIADYLDALMITRENARVAAKLVQNVTDMGVATVNLLEKTGMSRKEADKIVALIQETFLRHIQEKDNFLIEKPSEEMELLEESQIILDILNEAQVTPERADAAAKIIQQTWAHFKERKSRERELLSGMIDWRVAARSAIHLYRKSGATNEEANRAATLIKAAYKGYYTRKIMRKLVDETSTLYIDMDRTFDYDLFTPGGEFPDDDFRHEEHGSTTSQFGSLTSDEPKQGSKVGFGSVVPSQADIKVTTPATASRGSAEDVAQHILINILHGIGTPESGASKTEANVEETTAPTEEPIMKKEDGQETIVQPEIVAGEPVDASEPTTEVPQVPGAPEAEVVPQPEPESVQPEGEIVPEAETVKVEPEIIVEQPTGEEGLVPVVEPIMEEKLVAPLTGDEEPETGGGEATVTEERKVE